MTIKDRLPEPTSMPDSVEKKRSGSKKRSSLTGYRKATYRQLWLPFDDIQPDEPIVSEEEIEALMRLLDDED